MPYVLEPITNPDRTADIAAHFDVLNDEIDFLFIYSFIKYF